MSLINLKYRYVAGDLIYPKVTLNNVKIIAGSDDENLIYLNTGSSIDVKNYRLFGNRNPDPKVHLKIGNAGNFLFIQSNDLT